MSERLLNEIRAAKPAAPPALRERVRALGAQEPGRAPFLSRFEWRRLVLVAPAALVVAVIAGSVIGLTRDDVVVGGGGDQAVSSSGATEEAVRGAPAFETQATDRGALKGLAAPPATANTDSGAAIAPVPGQLQRFEAELRLRVNDVEAAFADGLSPQIEAALAELSAGEREVIALRVLLDLDGEEAARVLGISPTAVSTRLSRALKKLEEKVSVNV